MSVKRINVNSEILFEPPETKKLKSGRVVLNPGEAVGEHSTENKEEILLVLKGTATVIELGNEIKLEEGKSYYIKNNISHSIIII